MIRRGQQSGYILLAVIVVVTLVAAIALMMNYESAIETSTTGSELDARQAQYVAEAGLNHALWLTAQQGCGAYSDLNNVSFGNDQYSSSLITDLGSTSSYSVSVDQDTWIKSDSLTDNYASDTVLHISNLGGVFERPMYRFDLTPVPASASILSATAWFYVSKEHPEGFVDIHRITADWTETDATWDSMGANIDSALLASIPTQPASGVWVSVNLTAPVQAWVNGQPNFGITLNSTADGINAEYASRESLNAPYLQVVVGTAPYSPASLNVVGTLANGVNRSIKRNNVTLYQQPPSYHRLQLDLGSGKDVMLDSFYNIRNHGDYALQLSSDPGWIRRPLIQFDLPAIPSGARILSAQLELYHQSTSGTNVDPGASVFRVTQDWVEGTKAGGGIADGATWDTWDGFNNWTVGGGDYDAVSFASKPLTAAAGDWESWEINTLVKGWLDGNFPNHGLLLKGSGTVDIRLASKEDADTTLHPRLTISYACSCGSPCIVPQGSGDLLMVVVNPTTLVPTDAYKKQLFESWGYTVSALSETANQTTYDSAVASSDVVFISETANAMQVGSKLAGASIGVVSQDGDYNADLGFASGSAWLVGSAINITDTSHYITSPFTTGPVDIYAGGMQQLTISGSTAVGLQILADTAAAGSLVVLDKSAVMEGGGSAAGRRVMLPIGRDINIDWSKLNSNGQLIVQRALQWGAENPDTGSANTLILSTESAATLGGLSFDDIDLAEYDMDADTASLFFEGGNQTLKTGVIALHVLANGHLILASNPASPGPKIAGLSFAPGDLVDYDPVADSATLIFDGAALFGSAEIVTAVHVLDNGHLVLATATDAILGGLSFTDRDLVEYDPATDTASLFFDGSLTTLNGDITALHILDNGHLILAVRGFPFSTLGGLIFAPGDLVDYDPVADTATLFFEASTRFSSTNERLNSVHFGEPSGSL